MTEPKLKWAFPNGLSNFASTAFFLMFRRDKLPWFDDDCWLLPFWIVADWSTQVIKKDKERKQLIFFVLQ